MKKVYLLVAGLLSYCGLFAQQGQDDGKVDVIYPVEFKITKPLRELVSEEKAFRDIPIEERQEARDKDARRPYVPFVGPEAKETSDDLPVVQKTMGTKSLPAPLVSWDGLNDGYYPPDPTGAAGSGNYYVQGVNTSYKVYSKTGSSLTSSFGLSSLWSGTTDDGDPIILYDKMADRWFISQFQANSPYKVCIAVSVTNDPTGSYYSWVYSSTQLPDYLKFSVWQDGYYMCSNQSTQKVIVFERSAMLTGAASPRMLVKNNTFPTNGYFFCPLPADADGQLPPAGTPCPIFTYTDNGWGGSYTDAIKVWEMTVNWVPSTPTATITNVATLATQPFNSAYDYTGWDDIAQPGTSAKLDGIGGVFNFRAQHRCWTGYNSVVLCMAEQLTSKRGIRWFELRKNTSTNTWSIYQEGTYAPDSYNRWCGSIAMDDNGSIAMAYSISGSSTVYPGIRYTGRNASDPLGTMTYAEQTGATGSGVQTAANRWGDYSHTALDPSDGTMFWHTGEYLSSGNIRTRIFKFQIPVPTGIESANEKAKCTVYQSGSELIIKGEELPEAKNLVVDLFDINGNKIQGKIVEINGGKIETSISVGNLATGTYLVRIGETNTSFQKVTKVIIH
jgi:hypothetical protein